MVSLCCFRDLQSIETITNDLGLKANDMEGIKERLRRQGINAMYIDVKGQTEEDEKQAFKKAIPPPLTDKRGDKVPTSSIPVPEDSFGVVARLFYSPPKSLEQLIQSVGASLIDEDPQISVAALGNK